MSEQNAKPKAVRYAYAGSALPVPAQVAGEELARIEARDGGVVPSVLVEESRPEDAPLHPAFTWDEEQAAAKCRLMEAARVIRTVRVVATDPDTGRRTKPPAFVSVVRRETQQREYVAAARAMSDEEYRLCVLAEALAQLDGLRRRYEGLRELQPVWDAIQAGTAAPAAG